MAAESFVNLKCHCSFWLVFPTLPLTVCQGEQHPPTPGRARTCHSSFHTQGRVWPRFWQALGCGSWLQIWAGDPRKWAEQPECGRMSQHSPTFGDVALGDVNMQETTFFSFLMELLIFTREITLSLRQLLCI